MSGQKHFSLFTFHFAFCTPRHARATALIETAIVLPVYMILLFGLLYFGYATLGRQRQDKATAYAAWQSAPPMGTDLLATFWGTTQPADTQFSLNGGSEDRQPTRQGDEYYGMQRNLALQGSQWSWPDTPNYNPSYNDNDDITGNVTTFVPYQLGSFHQIWGGGSELFDCERVAVDLWNFALGSTTQSFTWTPGAGAVQQFNTSYTSFARYLNIAANPPASGLGLMLADNNDPPTTLLAAVPGWGGLLSAALNGPPSGGPWLQRRAVESTMNYEPPFLRAFWADEGTAPTADFSQYAALNYPAPANPPPTATMDCDVTIRNSAVLRQGAEEGAQNAGQFLTVVGPFIGENGTPFTPPDSLDGLLLNGTGLTFQQAWNPQ